MMIPIPKTRHFSLLVLLLALVIFQTGCAFKDIDRRAFVVGIGIDPSENDENKYKVTLKIAIPTGSLKQTTSPKYAYLSHEGETLGESLRMLETQIDKVLELGHAKTIIINEKILSKDIRKMLDYFVRRADVQLITWIAAAKPSAEDVLKIEPKTESVASVALFNFFDKNGTESPYITTSFLFDFRRNIIGEGINAVIPLIEIDKDEEKLVINKSVVIKEKHKPFELTPTQTKYYNSLFRKMSGLDYKVKHKDLTMLLNIETVKMKYKMINEKGKPPRIDMHVTMIGIIGESNKDLSWNNLDQYNEYANIALKKKIVNLLTSVQKEDLDPFGFGLRYRATRLNDKNTIKEWESIYPNLEFDITMDIRLKSTGAIQ